MADLSTHYKERTPLETVNLIKKFFKDNGYELKQTESQRTEAGTWYCHVDVYKDGILFRGAHGKGMTEEYALASGYAELYERFCNKIFFLANPCWERTFMNMNKTNNGYYFSPEERIQTYDEVLEYKAVSNYFNKLASGDLKLVKQMIDFVTDGIYVGAPMYNISDKNDILYLDPRLLLRLQRSNGMAAGNTLNEALVQGSSELMERYVSNLVLFKNMSQTYYALDLNKITNVDLQDKIKNIKAAGYELYLIDLSYNYKLPVMMSLLLDRKQGIVRMNFGCFPVFDIAAERVLTELYQGIASFHNSSFTAELQHPYRLATEGEMRGAYGNSISGLFLSGDFIDKLEFVDNYNSEVFIDKHNGNDELLDYYKELTKKIGIKLYYLNNSLSKELYAVHILIYPLSEKFIFEQPLDGVDFTKDAIEIQKTIIALSTLKECYSNMYENKPVNIPKLINLLVDAMDDPQLQNTIINVLLWNTVNIASRDDSNLNLLITLVNLPYIPINGLPSGIIDTELYLSFRKYLQLATYVQTNMYTAEELLNIFNNIFNYNISEEDIMKCMSPAYLLQKVYVEPFTEYIHSEGFYKFVNTYTNPR